MRDRDRRAYAVAVALLAVQVSVAALGTIGMCVDRPHTHGGVPAPDCLMHSSQPVGTAPDGSHHSHHAPRDNSTSPDTARLVCSCSSDPLALLTMEIAVVPGDIAIALPNPMGPSSPERTQSELDVRLTPLSPPPRPSLS